MDVFKDYLSSIDSPDHRLRMEEILSWTAGR
ncbi:iron chaperone, partial [Bacillus velezensis]